MANFSLINVHDTNTDGTINGSWLQGCCGTTLAEATKRARSTEAANSNRITVVVVDELSPCAWGAYRVKRLDN